MGQAAPERSLNFLSSGAVFEEEGRGEPYPAYQGLLKSRFLVDYLRTIQEK